MRKKILLISICALLLVGCGGGKPSDVSQEMYDVAVYTVKATDLYLDGEVSAEDTYDKIDSLSIPEADLISEDFVIDSSILSLKTSLLGVDIGSHNLSDVKAARNELADLINYNE